MTKTTCEPDKDGCQAMRKAIKMLWNKITGTVLILIVTFIVSWFTFGNDVVSLVKAAPEMQQEIKINTEERIATKKDVEHNTEGIEKLVRLGESDREDRMKDREEQKAMFAKIMKKLDKN